MLTFLFACAGAVTFTEVEAEVLGPSCAFSSCHGAGAGELTLDGQADHARLVDVAAVAAPGEVLVIPGDPDGSYLIAKLEGHAGIVGEPMPPPAGGLDPEMIELVRSWIEAGAADD
jgi:hypothetical protein